MKLLFIVYLKFENIIILMLQLTVYCLLGLSSSMLFRNVVRKQRTMAQMSTHIFSALLYRLQTPTPNTIDDIFYSNISCECKKYKDKSNEIISFSTHARVGFTQASLLVKSCCFYILWLWHFIFRTTLVS